MRLIRPAQILKESVSKPEARYVLQTDLIVTLSSKVLLLTKIKHYAMQFRELSTPAHEDTPRYEGPGSGSIFYYGQEDDLFRIQKRRNSWHYNIIRPMGIIGFTPQCKLRGVNRGT